MVMMVATDIVVMMVMVNMVVMVDRTGEDRQNWFLNLTFQLSCDWQLSKCLRCFQYIKAYKPYTDLIPSRINRYRLILTQNHQVPIIAVLVSVPLKKLDRESTHSYFWLFGSMVDLERRKDKEQ